MASVKNITERDKRAREIHRRLKKVYPDPQTALIWATPIELFVAVILSAQCTDVRVNQVTAGLFKKYRDVADYAAANPGRFEEDIKPTGFFRNKTKNILAAAAIILEDHQGRIPRTMEEMTALPGIGRKSANIILFEVHGLITGIPVDTHVKRVSKRLGLTNQTDPEKIETELMEQLPKKDWYIFSSELIFHGRAVCAARRPLCRDCLLNDFCPSAP